jgi:hypothetical protein
MFGLHPQFCVGFGSVQPPYGSPPLGHWASALRAPVKATNARIKTAIDRISPPATLLVRRPDFFMFFSDKGGKAGTVPTLNVGPAM